VSARDKLFELACDDMPVTSDEVNEAIDAYAHELAEEIRTHITGVITEHGIGYSDEGWFGAADLIDPKVLNG
jgi:hypothetical protein